VTPLARLLDATLLTPWATPAEVRAMCEEACALEVAAVCVLPFHVPLAASITSGTSVAVAAAIAFPFGGASPEAKAMEAGDAASSGARELDLVLNLGAIRAGAWDVVLGEVSAVKRAQPGRLTKWIVECAALSGEEIRRAVLTVLDGGGDFVKTSTGYGPGGATVADVRLLRSLAGPMGVKASGGIRTREFALELRDAGANRIGTSSPRAILAGADATKETAAAVEPVAGAAAMAARGAR
jgi:deoxyribose-phosphate aldolase